MHTLAYQEWEAGVSLPEHINSDLRKKYEVYYIAVHHYHSQSDNMDNDFQ